MIRLATGVLLAGLILTAGCEGRRSGQPAEAGLATPAPVTELEIAALQVLADDACRCARASPEDKTCRDAFTARTARHGRGAEVASACAPVSTEMSCFNEDRQDAQFCIVTGYSLVGTGRTLCSAEEARIVDATFNATLERTSDDYGQASVAATRAADALIRGERVSLPIAEAGCTG